MPKITDPAKPRRPWTTAENETLRSQYPVKGAKVVAAMLGRTPRAVTLHAGKLGVSCDVCVQYSERNAVKATPSAAKSPPVRRAMSGPFYADAVVELYPNFKFTQALAPPQPLRTNTYPVY